ncbi:MAG TPA: TIGR03435 family protein [Acidobacteriaceae bacterium]
MNRFLASLPLILAPVVFAQTSLPSSPATKPPAQTDQPKFVIADVHASPTAYGFVQNFGGVLREGLYVNRDATMLNLIESAYGIKEDAISGGPGWVSSAPFDVVAKVPDGTTVATANLMLQNLLAERFGLVVHNGTSPVPRYVLSVGKGSKLKSAAPSEDSGCKPLSQPTGPPPSDLSLLPNIKVACHNLTAAAIADNLHQMAGGYLDHDVVDSTSLEGAWDFDIEWTARAALSAKGADGISIFDAVEKQLGLKLELKNIPMPSLAIASVNRKPTPNTSNIAAALALPQARFEVAVIKPADPNARPFNGLLYTGGSQMRAGGTLRSMIAMTLQVSPNLAADMVTGLPKSAETQSWDITAKVPSTGEGAPNMVNGRPLPPPFSIGLEMLRGLLLDQFELKTHTENREVTVYALTVSAKSKMTRADDEERSGCKPDPSAPRPFPSVQTMIGCKNTSMGELAEALQQMANAYIDHPIVDATGLEGGWDFTMGWTPKAKLQAPRTPSPNADGAATTEAAAPDGISVFEAMERELGLKLVKEKRSIPVIVVDHVDEKPLE